MVIYLHKIVQYLSINDGHLKFLQINTEYVYN